MKLTRYVGNPVLTPVASHDWESRTVFNCGVAQQDGKIILIYRAQGMNDDVSRLGYAESRDGLRFERAPEPVFTPKDATEALGVEDPRLTFLDGRWQMLYTA